MPPEPGSLRIPSPFNPTTTHSEPSHQQHSGATMPGCTNYHSDKINHQKLNEVLGLTNHSIACFLVMPASQ
eukprot:170277-Pelagomonas_calceolata.AAC.1